MTTTWSFQKAEVWVSHDHDKGLEVASMGEWPGLGLPIEGGVPRLCAPVAGLLEKGPGLILAFDCTDPAPSDAWVPPPGTCHIGTIIRDTSATTPRTQTIYGFVYGPGDFVAVINGNAVAVGDSEVLGSQVLTIVPEPGTATLLGMGLVGLIIAARRRG